VTGVQTCALPIFEVSTSVTQTGYPKVTPEKPFTYPPPVEVSTSVTQTGYPKGTPEKPFTYPPAVGGSSSVTQTGYPKVTPERPFTYPPPVEVSTSVTQTGYPKVTPEKPFTYFSPAERFTGETAIPRFPQQYPSDIVSNSPSEITLKGSTKPQNLGEPSPFIYNNHKATLELLKVADSSVETSVHAAPRLATSNMVRSKLGAADLSISGGRYQPLEEKVDIKRAVPGEPGIDYPVYISVPDTPFSCKGRHEGRFLLRF
jgi:hypothetical protein